MKRHILLLSILGGFIGLNGCTTVIDAKLDTGPTQLSVDAQLTNQPGPQTIRLTKTAGYFDSSTSPAATSATVTVTDDAGKTYRFIDSTNTGYYVWKPIGKDTLGHIGRTYQLNIAYGGETFQATSKINPVPPVDSANFCETGHLTRCRLHKATGPNFTRSIYPNGLIITELSFFVMANCRTNRITSLRRRMEYLGVICP